MMVAFITVLFVSSVHAVYYYRNTDYHLCIPNNNVFLNFDEFRDFTVFYPDNGTRTLYFGLPATYTVSSLVFSGTNVNVTINELGENGKLYVADVAGGSDRVVNFTLGYNYPYLQTVDGEVSNIDVHIFDDNRLTWSAEGAGAATMRVHFPDGQTPYYLKVNGVVKMEGNNWDASGNTVTVTDYLASTHDYELSFTGLPSPPDSSTDKEAEEDSVPDQLVDLIVTGKNVFVENWGIVLCVAGIIVIGVMVYLYRDSI